MVAAHTVFILALVVATVVVVACAIFDNSGGSKPKPKPAPNCDESFRKENDGTQKSRSQKGDRTFRKEKRVRKNEAEENRHTSSRGRKIEEEQAPRRRVLQIQAEEAQRERQRQNQLKPESMRIDLEKRQKQRLEEMRSTQKKDEENMKIKEIIRTQVRKELNKLEMKCHNLASLLHSLGICVGGWPNPSQQEVQAAYKRALLTFHPDRLSKSDICHQVEAEEKFKFIHRLKDI